ncbi:hypothetical protein Trydic_g5831 [Trypoxylus dichotomus]
MRRTADHLVAPTSTVVYRVAESLQHGASWGSPTRLGVPILHPARIAACLPRSPSRSAAPHPQCRTARTTMDDVPFNSGLLKEEG